MVLFEQIHKFEIAVSYKHLYRQLSTNFVLEILSSHNTETKAEFIVYPLDVHSSLSLCSSKQYNIMYFRLGVILMGAAILKRKKMYNISQLGNEIHLSLVL